MLHRTGAIDFSSANAELQQVVWNKKTSASKSVSTWYGSTLDQESVLLESITTSLEQS
jgi:hypothetical protein